MKFRTKIVSGRRAIAASGVFAVLLLSGWIAIPYLLDHSLYSLTPEEAEEDIRLYLLIEAAEKYLVDEDGNMGVPDREAALRYEEEVDRIDNLEFVSVEVRRTIIPPHLRRSRPHFVVKAVIRDRENIQTRYFWSDAIRVVRETSKLHWYIPV